MVRVAPTTHSGQVLGLIVAVRPPNSDQFTTDDDTMLTELARQVGLALHNVELDSALQESLDEVRRQADELRASRARIVAASDAARRQIERNLHDGAQQHLVALAVNVRLARQLAERDPEASGKILDQLGVGIQEAVQELRALAHGIYPPLLIDRGIAEALRSAAGRAALPTEVDAEGLDRYSPDRESAVYFCCLEALQNAGKHAGEGAAASVRVWQDDTQPELRGARHRGRVRRQGHPRQRGGLREHERPGGGDRRHGERASRARARGRPSRAASPSALTGHVLTWLSRPAASCSEPFCSPDHMSTRTSGPNCSLCT